MGETEIIFEYTNNEEEYRIVMYNDGNIMFYISGASFEIDPHGIKSLYKAIEFTIKHQER